MTTSPEAVDNTGALSEDGAAEAFLRKWQDASEPSDASDGDTSAPDDDETSSEGDDSEAETEENDDEDDADPEEGDADDEDEAEEQPKAKRADEDAEVEITVDGETHKVSVKDLKRLYGQEASLTRKSQEVAAKRKEIEDTGAKYALGLERMLKTAEDRYAPYAEIDFLVAAKQMDADDFAQLRAEAQAAYEEYNFVKSELDGFVKNLETQRQTVLREQAREAVRVLQDPEKGIPGWSNALYDEIRHFAVGQGLKEEIVNTIVDPVVIKLLYGAMQHSKGSKVATEKKAKAAPRKVIKSTATPVAQNKGRDKLAQLRSKGDIESATEAFLARWSQ